MRRGAIRIPVRTARALENDLERTELRERAATAAQNKATRLALVAEQARTDVRAGRGTRGAPATGPATNAPPGLTATSTIDERFSPFCTAAIVGFVLAPASRRIPAVRGVPISCVDNFQLLAGRLLATVDLAAKGGSDSLKSLVSEAFLFFPAILPAIRKGRKDMEVQSALLSVLEATDPLLRILEARNNFMRVPSQGRKQPQTGMPKEKIIKKAELCILAGNLGKAGNLLGREAGAPTIKVTESDGTVSTEVRKLISDLFPYSNPIFPSATSGHTTANPTLDNLYLVVKKLKRLSSSGMQSWTFELIKLLCKIPPLAELVLSLCKHIIGGSLGASDTWVSSLLVFCPKKNGGKRGICVDGVWLRLAAKLAILCVDEEVANLGTIQFGVGIKGGCQAVVHAASCWEIAMRDQPGKVVASLDISKAFNLVSREAILNGVTKYAPALLSSFCWEYGGAGSDLWSDEGILLGKVSTGIRTGDVKGPLFFSVAIQDVLLHVQRVCPETVVVAYLDDILVFGDVDKVDEATQLLATSLSSIGLHLNLPKSKVFSHFPLAREECAGIQICYDGLVVLGSPIGKEHFIITCLTTLVDEWIKELQIINSLQAALAFPYTKFVARARPVHFLRSICPWLWQDQLIRYDAEFLNFFTIKFANSLAIDDVGRLVMYVPSKEGGFGMPPLAFVSPSAWSASFLEANSIFKGSSAWSVFESGARCFERFHDQLSASVPDYSKVNMTITSQKELIKGKIKSDIIPDILVKAVGAKKAMFLAQAKGEAKWLCAGVRRCGVDDKVFCDAVKLRLLAPIKIFESPTLCSCNLLLPNRAVDLSAANQVYHCFSCIRDQTGIISRHDNGYLTLGSIIMDRLRGVTVDREHIMYGQTLGLQKKCDLHIKLNDGSTFVLDFSIVNSLSASYVDKDSGQAIAAREKEKEKAYLPILGMHGMKNFVPFVIDIAGNFGTHALLFLDLLCAHPSCCDHNLRDKIILAISVARVTWLSKSIHEFLASITRVANTR